MYLPSIDQETVFYTLGIWVPSKWEASTKARKPVWELWYLSLKYAHRLRVPRRPEYDNPAEQDQTGFPERHRVWKFLACTITSYWGTCVGCPPLRLHSTPCAEMPNCFHQVLRQTQVLMQFHSCSWAQFRSKIAIGDLVETSWPRKTALRHGLNHFPCKCMEKKHVRGKQSQLLGSSLQLLKLPPDTCLPPRASCIRGQVFGLSSRIVREGANLWPLKTASLAAVSAGKLPTWPT